MLIHHGDIIRQSRIPPEFLLNRQINSLVASPHVYEFQIPNNRDLQLQSLLVFGTPTGAELVTSIQTSVRRFNQPVGDEVILSIDGPGAAATRFAAFLPVFPGTYIPRDSILRAVVTFSAGVLAKVSGFHLTGWLVPSYDVKL
jgi:hypothetical protein